MSLHPIDLLVFAPHPDDEAIGTAGVIQQAIAAGKSVRIVFATNGDAYPLAASRLAGKPIEELRSQDYMALAATRQQEAVAAGRLLGLSADTLLFLGYPDAGLTAIRMNESGSPLQSPFSARRAPYGPVQTDYHTLAHGRAGEYTRSSVLADVTEILRESRPAQVYVTHQADAHPTT